MSADSSRQIKQMVNFIIQEAHEKVNEINIKANHDSELEKQNLIHNGKLKIQEEYAQKEKDLEVEQRVSRSASIGSARVKKMKSRDELLEGLKKETLEKLAAFCKGPDYAPYIRKLLVQGLIKIEEQEVEVQCKAEDKAIVAKVLPEAVAEFKSIMQQAGHNVNPKVILSNNVLSSKAVTGGVVLTALNNRIVLNQTIDERLQIAYTDVMPAVRRGLFSKST